jgi:hypothetical protein
MSMQDSLGESQEMVHDAGHQTAKPDETIAEDVTSLAQSEGLPQADERQATQMLGRARSETRGCSAKKT